MKLTQLISLCIFAISVWAVPVTHRRPLIPLPVKIFRTDLRIVGGNLASEGQFPWQVGIFFDTEYGSFFCGGALIDSRWVLTGAHCIHEAIEIALFLGTTSLTSGGELIDATYSIAHPDYNPETLENDIGLIRIDRNIELNDKIQVIPIAMTDLQNETPVTTSGWGAVNNDGGLNMDLNYINLTTISNSECKFSYGVLIPDQMVCAVGNRNNGICTGDSGDPLIMTDSSGKSVHVGVASWSSASGCLTSQPSTYTRTASYKDWISSVTSSKK